MLSSLAAGAVIALSAVLACSSESEPGAASPTTGGVDAAHPDFHVRIPYSRQGVPGPWWRDNAMHADFDVDQQTCRSVSSEARKAVGSEDRNAAAYRAFLDCMIERDWTRGVPPPQSEAG